MEGEGYPRREILRKYAGNDLKGRKALQEGTTLEMPERKSVWGTDYSTNIIFTPESEERIASVATQLKEVGERLGIDFFLVSQDYPPHSALQSGWFRGDDKAKRDPLYDRIYEDAAVQRAAERLRGLELEYKFLIVSSEAITLNAVEIPIAIKEFRDATVAAARSVAGETGEVIESQNMDNILHISLARFRDIREEGKKGSLKKLEQKLITLRHELSSNPIRLRVDRVFFGHVMNEPRENI